MNFVTVIKKLTNRLFGAKTKGETEMAKVDVVQAGFAAIQLADEQVLKDELGKAYDAGLADAPPATGGVDQSVVDGLNQQIANLQAKDALDMQAVVDTKAAGDAALATLQASFDTLSAKESGEAQAVANFQAAKEQLAALLASLSSIGAPPPVIVPDPAPAV